MSPRGPCDLGCKPAYRAGNTTAPCVVATVTAGAGRSPQAPQNTRLQLPVAAGQVIPELGGCRQAAPSVVRKQRGLARAASPGSPLTAGARPCPGRLCRQEPHPGLCRGHWRGSRIRGGGAKASASICGLSPAQPAVRGGTASPTEPPGPRASGVVGRGASLPRADLPGAHGVSGTDGSQWCAALLWTPGAANPKAHRAREAGRGPASGVAGGRGLPVG